MNARTFVDSNVFLYAAEKRDIGKSEQAGLWLRHLLASGSGVANLQVMNEITNVLIKRGQMEPETVFTIVDGFSAFGRSSINVETVAAARLLHFQFGYSWWDCVLLASAIEMQCRYFLSEDLHDGHQLHGLTIISPFRHSPPQIALH